MIERVCSTCVAWQSKVGEIGFCRMYPQLIKMRAVDWCRQWESAEGPEPLPGQMDLALEPICPAAKTEPKVDGDNLPCEFENGLEPVLQRVNLLLDTIMDEGYPMAWPKRWINLFLRPRLVAVVRGDPDPGGPNSSESKSCYQYVPKELYGSKKPVGADCACKDKGD